MMGRKIKAFRTGRAPPTRNIEPVSRKAVSHASSIPIVRTRTHFSEHDGPSVIVFCNKHALHLYVGALWRIRQTCQWLIFTLRKSTHTEEFRFLSTGISSELRFQMLNKEIQELCFAATHEADPEKLLSLVDQLNKALANASETRSDGTSQDARVRNEPGRDDRGHK